MVELPELQVFAARNEGVEDVLFLTINNELEAMVAAVRGK